MCARAGSPITKTVSTPARCRFISAIGVSASKSAPPRRPLTIERAPMLRAFCTTSTSNGSAVTLPRWAVALRMKDQGHGTIVNVGSDAARVGSTGEAVYSAAKGGIVAFTKTLARETARYGITANAVCPGPADTPLFAQVSADAPKLRDSLERAIPLRRLAQPEDLANAVAFLVSPRTGYVTGQTLSVSGGLTMI